MAFNLPLAMIQQVIATGPTKAPLQKMRESHVKNAIEQCKSFVYQVDNMVRQSIDALFGGTLYPSSLMNKILTLLLILLLIGAWIYFLVRVIYIWRQDHEYQYYYHEEAKFYMTAFKWAAPVLMAIPLLGLGFGVIHKPTALKQPVAAVATSNKDQASSILNSIKEASNTDSKNGKHKLHLGSLADDDPNFVNQMVSSGKAEVATYTEIQSATRVDTNKAHRLSLVRFTEPHFRLAAYQNAQKISTFIFMVYGLMFTDFMMMALLIWHDNSSADQW